MKWYRLMDAAFLVGLFALFSNITKQVMLLRAGAPDASGLLIVFWLLCVCALWTIYVLIVTEKYR